MNDDQAARLYREIADRIDALLRDNQPHHTAGKTLGYLISASSYMSLASASRAAPRSI